MRTWTGSRLSVVAVSALWMLGAAACTPSNPDNPDDDGQGGSGTTTTTGTGTGTGTGGEGGNPPACETKQPATDAAFVPTGGPDPYMFGQIAATSKVVLATTGVSAGLYRSTDGGDTWEYLDAEGVHGKEVIALAVLGDEIFVTVNYTSILRSKDGGDTWEDVSSVDCTAPHHLSVHGQDLFALSGGRPFRWDATAESWEALPDDDLGFDILEFDGHYLYANSMYTPGVFRLDLTTLAEDGQWTPVADLPEWGYKAFAFADGKGFAANSTQVFRTEDDGQTWKPLGSDAPVDVHDLLVVDGAIFAAASSGLHVTTDGGGKWAKADVGPTGTSWFLAGDGTRVFSAGDALRRSEGVDGAWQKLHVMADSVWQLSPMVGSVLSLSLGGSFRTTDAGATWEPIQIPENEALSWESQAVVRDGKVFAHGHHAVMVSSDDGATFQGKEIAQLGTYDFLSLLASTDAGLVVGVSKGAGSGCPGSQDITTTLFLSTDQGDTWTPAMNGFPVTFTDCYGKDYTPMITGLLQVEGALLATTYHSGAYRSEDGGKEWALLSTPEDVGDFLHFASAGEAVLGALKDGGVARSVDAGKTWQKTAFQPKKVSSFASAGDTVFASVGDPYEPDGGVFYSVDAGVSWKAVDAGFGARVRSLAILDNKLYAGTVEESTWSLELACATP